ncbi:MAG: GAF domain-containing protein, partial [Thermoguttaceae bacterium]
HTVALEKIVAAFETGRQHFEWEHKRLDGTQIPVDVHLVRIEHNGKRMLVSSVRDLREEKQIQREVLEAGERTRLMLESIPIACGLINEHFEMIDCNQATVKLFLCYDKEDACKRFFQLFPPHQPGGQASSVLAIQVIGQSFETGYHQLEWVFQLPSGELMPTELTVVRVKYDNNLVLAVYMRDLREVKKLESSLKKIESVRKATNQVADILMSFHEGDFDNRLKRAMQLIAYATNVSKVFIGKNFTDAEGKLCFKLVCSHHVEGSLPCRFKRQCATGVAYEMALPTFEAMLKQGSRITCNIDDLDTPDRHFLLRCNAVSVMIIPIFISGEFWGHIRLVDCVNKRSFLEGEVEVMQTCASIFASAIMENEAQEELQQRGMLSSTVNKIAESLMYSQHWNFDKHLNDSMKLICDTLNLDRVCISKIDDDDFENDCFTAHPVSSKVVYEYTKIGPTVWGTDLSPEEIEPDDFACLRKRVLDGKIVEMRRSESRGKTLECFKKYQTFSYYGLPIFVEGKFWGILRLENCHEEQVLSQNELEMIDTCSHLFASAFVEYKAKTELAESNLRLTYASEKAERLGQVKTQF